MEQLITKYLGKYVKYHLNQGFIDHKNIISFENQVTKNQNTENKFILRLIEKSIFDKKNTLELSQHIYNNFVAIDDEHILKLFRKLFIIKRHFLKIKELFYFSKLREIIVKQKKLS